MNRWGRLPATSLAAVWHASIQVQREDGVCKVRRRMLLGSPAVAGHGIPLAVVAVGKAKGWLAGRQAVGVEMPCA